MHTLVPNTNCCAVHSTTPSLILTPCAPTTTDVEAEKRYQEKRAAEKAGEPIPPPPVVLWRSVRELGVWLKDLHRARSAGALGGATYAAAELVDRAHVSVLCCICMWWGRQVVALRCMLLGVWLVKDVHRGAWLDCSWVSLAPTQGCLRHSCASHSGMFCSFGGGFQCCCDPPTHLPAPLLCPPLLRSRSRVSPHTSRHHHHPHHRTHAKRMMANLALSRIRTGQAAYMADDRENAVLRKSELLLGPTPTDAVLQAEAAAAAGTAAAAAAAAAAADDARYSSFAKTSSGRRVKVGGVQVGVGRIDLLLAGCVW